MRLSRSPGFSMIELLISIAILGILSTVSYVSLNSTRYQDELYTAARVVADDLRSMQSEALSSTNVKICSLGGGLDDVCQTITTGCTPLGSCIAQAGAAYGVSFDTGNGTSYKLYVKSASKAPNWYRVADRETLQTRTFSSAGAPDVIISAYTAVPASADAIENVVFLRQNGTMQILPCVSVGTTCTSANTLIVTLKNKVTNATVNVSMNAATGRISTDF